MRDLSEPLAIAERGLGRVPRPADGAWCRRTLDLLYEADRAARELTGLPPRTRRSFSGAGHCAGCDGPHDAETPGCENCRARHGMRRLHHERRRFHVV